MDRLSAFKTLRARPGINRAVRQAVLALNGGMSRLSDWLSSRWRVFGEVSLDLGDTRVRMFSAADDGIVNRLYYGQPWEVAELRTWPLLVAHARTVFDVGANTGVYSVLSARLRPDARILAFEPHPTNYRRLLRNLELNNARNVQAFELALGDEVRRIEFTIPDDEQVSLVSSALRPFAESHYNIAYKQRWVGQTTLDCVVRDHGLEHVDLVKIDVESYELAVLRGAEETLAKHRPVLLCEIFDFEVMCHLRPTLEGTIDRDQHLAIEELLRRHGYQFYAIGTWGLLRVDHLNWTDSGCNYVLSPVRTPERFLPWTHPDRFALLMRERP